MDEFLEVVQEIDPLWSVALVAAALFVLLVAKLWRPAFAYVLAGVFAFAVVGGFAGAGYYGYVYLEDQRRLDGRRTLDERVEVLFAKRIEADSIYACIDGSPAPAMFEGCERSLFAEPQRVAAAVAIVTQRLIFLQDALGFVKERDPSYAERIAPIRNAIEADPYGFVAFVLSVEHGCTHESCGRFSLFRDASRVRENMRVRRFEAFIAKHQTTWRGSSELPEDSLPTVGERATSPLVTISEPAAPPAAEDAPAVPGAATAPPVISVPAVPVTAPMVTPPSAATVAAEPPAAATAPILTPPADDGFKQPPTAAAPAPAPAAAKGAGDTKSAGEPRAAPRPSPATQAKAKAKAADPVSRRSSEPVAGLPRVVPSDYIREAEEKEKEKESASAQGGARPQPGAPVSITPPRQNFTGN